MASTSYFDLVAFNRNKMWLPTWWWINDSSHTRLNYHRNIIAISKVNLYHDSLNSRSYSCSLYYCIIRHLINSTSPYNRKSIYKYRQYILFGNEQFKEFIEIWKCMCNILSLIIDQLTLCNWISLVYKTKF